MRTTVAEVKKIIETELSDLIITAYIEDANIFVDENLIDQDLSEKTLTSIEKWLAAHMLASTRERVAKEEGAGGAYIKYAGNFGEGLKSTPYGQQAVILDTSGTLLAFSDGKKKINIISL